jgi:hypothetical protein
MKKLSVLLAIALLSCVRSRDSRGAVVEDDKSIVFPDFFQSGTGGTDQTQSLDGATLRALLVVSQDLFPPDSNALPCWERPEGYDYRTVRQGDVTFVYVYVNPARCGRKVLAFDSGVKYAIGADGRILRRVFEGEPESPDDPSRYLPPAWLDGGTGLDGGQP